MKLLLTILILNFMLQDNTLVICDFKNQIGDTDWYVLDDGVMGGLSEGNLQKRDTGNALYTGTVRTENNGGFSSIRHQFEAKKVSEYNQVTLKVKGDGKSYQFRIKEKRSQRYSYIHSFDTSGEWEVISLPLDEFYPGFRGRVIDIPNYPGEVMEEIAILIGNKTKENFALEIESIYLE